MLIPKAFWVAHDPQANKPCPVMLLQGNGGDPEIGKAKSIVILPEMILFGI